MPRPTRAISESGIYHVMLRGINRMQLFYDDDDRTTFMKRLARYKDECGFSLLAWCLMGNHVHLLIKEGDTSLAAVMKKLELSYSHFYSAKYDWRGYLFQDRYKSKPIDSDEYLLAVVRYIHRNPLEAGGSLSTWTSYDDYLSSPGITDVAMVLGMLASDAEKSRLAFKGFVDAPSEGGHSFLDGRGSKGMSDSEAIETIRGVGGFSACADLCLLGKGERDRVVATLRSRGLSIRQIARLTGLSRGIVAAAKVRPLDYS